VGTEGEGIHLYTYNATDGKFVFSATLDSTVYTTSSLTLADLDSDTDLDLVAGNKGQANRLYLNNSGSFDAGKNITGDTDNTTSISLGDVDNDSDIDLVTGNDGQANRLYKRELVSEEVQGAIQASPGYRFSEDIGSAIRIISGVENPTHAVLLSDVDGDNDLDLLVGNYGAANRLYLNDGSGNFVSGVDIDRNAYKTTSMVFGRRGWRRQGRADRRHGR